MWKELDLEELLRKEEWGLGKDADGRVKSLKSEAEIRDYIKDGDSSMV
jgi:hypothetical protein